MVSALTFNIRRRRRSFSRKSFSRRCRSHHHRAPCVQVQIMHTSVNQPGEDLGCYCSKFQLIEITINIIII